MPNWDYQNNLLQISGSLYRYFGGGYFHGTDPVLDRILEEKRPRCVITLLIDAMGTKVLEQHLGRDSFFRSHLVREVSTVYPPTTTAAVTSFLSGRSPAENGWLGWNQYFREEEDNVILFLGRSQYGQRIYPSGFAEKKLPVRKLYDELNAMGIPAEHVMPGWSDHNPCGTFCELLNKTCMLSGKVRYIYAYWDVFDSFMHKHGMSCEETGEMLRELDEETARFAEKLPENVLLTVIADHGMRDVETKDLAEDSRLTACFSRAPGLEPRTAAFFLRENMRESFREMFLEKYGDSYELLDREEVIASGIFGPGQPHARFAEFIGDMTAFAKGDLDLRYGRSLDIKGDHAGMTEKERLIPLIVYTRE